MIRVIEGDCREELAKMPAESVHCCVTSPPYFGLRDYGVGGQIGLEDTLESYIEAMVAVFREVRRVLRKDGTVWLNLGDSYTSGGRTDFGPPTSTKSNACKHKQRPDTPAGLKPKDLMMVPARVALALQADGWWLRSDIIWAKPNPMPESVTDRPTSAHEHVFLLSKSPKYYFDAEAVREAAAYPDGPNAPDKIQSPYGQGFTRKAGKGNGNAKKDAKAVQDVQRNPAQGILLSKEGRIQGTCLQAMRQGAGDGVESDESREREVPSSESLGSGDGKDETLLRHAEGQSGNQAEASNAACSGTCDHLDAHSGRVAGDSGAPRDEMRILPERQFAADPGPCDPDQQGRAPHEDKRGPSVQALQQPQEGQAPGRNLRNVWTIATAPFPEAHFATFPPALVEPCIKAGTSEKGCCAECGAPWVREVERTGMVIDRSDRTHDKGRTRTSGTMLEPPTSKTLGWSPSCACDVQAIPCTILDPFGGSGTTGLVADRLGRDSILIELNPEYANMARGRITRDAPLFVECT